MPRKPLIEAGSILPPQPPDGGGDVMSRIIARDREKRTPSDDPGIQEPVNKDLQVPVDTGIQTRVNTGVQEYRDTEIQESVNKEKKGAAGAAIQKPRKPAIQVPVITEIQEPVLEPVDKATFDLPRSLHQRLKIRAATERRPARAILVELLTRYLQEEAS